MLYLLFQSKTNRDAEFKRMKERGLNVRRSSTRSQQLHPQYVVDYENKAIQADNGLGNTYYKTFFPVLYKIEEV